MPVEVLVAMITAIAAVVSGVVLKLAEKFLAKTRDQATQDDSISKGLRDDIARKEQEIGNLKMELNSVEQQQDELRKRWYVLLDRFSMLRIRTKSILLENGKTLEEIEAILPDVPDALDLPGQVR